MLGLSPEEAKKTPYIASMGVYVFKKDILLKLLRYVWRNLSDFPHSYISNMFYREKVVFLSVSRWRYPTANDFGSEIIPASAKECNVQVLHTWCAIRNRPYVQN